MTASAILFFTKSAFTWRAVEPVVEWAVVALLVATATAHLGRLNKLFELSCHFRAQYCIGSAVCLPICLALGDWWWAAAAFVCLAINLSAIVPWFGGTTYHGNLPGNGQRLKLALFNVEWQNDAYTAFLASVERHQPDLVVVQELSALWEAAIEVLQKQYPFFEMLAREEGSGIALYSRFPFDRVPVVLPEGDERPGILVKLDFAGNKISLLSIHPRAPIRRGHFKLRNDVLAAAADLVRDLPNPKLLVGDMNSSLWTPFLQDVEKRTKLTNVRKGFGILPSWPTFMVFKWLMMPIDHCLVSDDISVISVQTGENIGSDHLPLIVELEIPRDQTTTAPS